MTARRQTVADLPKPTQRHERGFTLIEALVAVVILIFGLVAVSQLLAVAASSNQVANGASAAAAAASQELERLQTVSIDKLVPGPALPARGAAFACDARYSSDRTIAGVGIIRTCWQITNVQTGLFYILVRSQVLSPFSGLTRAEFSTFRAVQGAM